MFNLRSFNSEPSGTDRLRQCSGAGLRPSPPSDFGASIFQGNIGRRYSGHALQGVGHTARAMSAVHPCYHQIALRPGLNSRRQAVKLRCNGVSNKYYIQGEKRAEAVGTLFARLAPNYDLINDLQSFGLHRHWKKLVARMAQVKPGQKALDLCCGTGDIAFELNKAGAEVIGLDFSPAMLELAQARLRERDRPGRVRPSLKFTTGDAMQISFDDATFDIVTVGYGLRNLESWERGLEEMVRVTRPGGKVLVLDFGKPDNPIWRSLFFFYLRVVVPLLGKIFCHDAAALAYILESLHAYPAQSGIAAKMKELGCQDIQIRNLMGGAMSIHYCAKCHLSSSGGALIS
jgi:demethylmenaquinone methyltransferase / 2-methoxy-6-polyprenyl-1,4-benzoquinol methylase